MSRSDRALPRYTRVAVLLHWLVAALVLAQASWGWWMQTIAKQPPGVRADAFNLHKSVGLVILALMLVRLGWRLTHRPPPLDALPRWQAMAARATHRLLYAALIVMPVTGYLGSVFSGYPVRWFGMRLPAWGWSEPWIKDLMSAIHLGTSIVLVAAIVLHVAASVRHALARDGYVRRMAWPRTPAAPVTLASPAASRTPR
jgi:cytochrome b561